MKPILFVAALAVAACSAGDAPGNAEAPAATPTGATVADNVAHASDAVAQAPKATPGELKTFRDWTVGCDNTLRCTMASLGPEQGEFPDVTLALTRDAGPAGGFALAVDGAEDAATKPVALVIDGQRFAIAGEGTAAPIGGRLAGGKALTVRSASGTTLATISLAGASAALRYIDSMQGRAGTVTATVAKGTAPASGVPVASTLPTIMAVASAGTAVTPTPAQLATMRKTAKCEGMAAERSDIFKPEAVALGGGRTLVLLPCSAGAYNVFATLFVLDNNGISQAKTDAETGFNESTDVTEVVNGQWDDDMLKTYAKARGLGDCGVAQNFVWDGARLRLIEQKEMGECRGNPNYITTWRAKVVRR